MYKAVGIAAVLAAAIVMALRSELTDAVGRGILAVLAGSLWGAAICLFVVARRRDQHP